MVTDIKCRSPTVAVRASAETLYKLKYCLLAPALRHAEVFKIEKLFWSCSLAHVSVCLLLIQAQYSGSVKQKSHTYKLW